MGKRHRYQTCPCCGTSVRPSSMIPGSGHCEHCYEVGAAVPEGAQWWRPESDAADYTRDEDGRLIPREWRPSHRLCAECCEIKPRDEFGRGYVCRVCAARLTQKPTNHQYKF